jgi:hypothetical protein
VVRSRLAERGEASRVLTVALFVWRVESFGSGLDGRAAFDGGDSIVRAPMFLVGFRDICIPSDTWTTILILLGCQTCRGSDSCQAAGIPARQSKTEQDGYSLVSTLPPTCTVASMIRSGLEKCFLGIDIDTVLGYKYSHGNPYIDWACLCHSLAHAVLSQVSSLKRQAKQTQPPKNCELIPSTT